MNHPRASVLHPAEPNRARVAVRLLGFPLAENQKVLAARATMRLLAEVDRCRTFAPRRLILAAKIAGALEVDVDVVDGGSVLLRSEGRLHTDLSGLEDPLRHAAHWPRGTRVACTLHNVTGAPLELLAPAVLGTCIDPDEGSP